MSVTDQDMEWSGSVPSTSSEVEPSRVGVVPVLEAAFPVWNEDIVGYAFEKALYTDDKEVDYEELEKFLMEEFRKKRKREEEKERRERIRELIRQAEEDGMDTSITVSRMEVDQNLKGEEVQREVMRLYRARKRALVDQIEKQYSQCKRRKTE